MSVVIKYMEKKEEKIAYFSMEIGLDPRIPTYSGGLGVLAGDTLKSFSDLSVPVVGVTILHRNGYFYQTLDKQGNQQEGPVHWSVDDFMELLPEKISVSIEGRQVWVQAWKYVLTGQSGYKVPIYFLDTKIPENSEWDQNLTSSLYGGDEWFRLAQEVVLGIGGVRMLEALNYDVSRYHMNEGHSALLTLELLKKFGDAERVKKKCVFTTHTPVPAGHDQFPIEFVKKMLGELPCAEGDVCPAGKLNMTLLALQYSHYVNGVAKIHGEVSRELFPGYPIDSITNGVHSQSWVCPYVGALYDEYMPGWRLDPFTLRHSVEIPNDKLWDAHQHAKRELIDYVNRETNAGMDVDVFTIGFARRATKYKRPYLLFRDKSRLQALAEKHGKIQILFAGKAHQKDEQGKQLIRDIVAIDNQIPGVRVAYLQNYDITICKKMVAGVDIWLNTPRRPKEASGTSGMKAAHNGVPHLSTLDGWWIEGHNEGLTGWSIGSEDRSIPSNDESDSNDLYTKLDELILPAFKERDKWTKIMKSVISFNASFFNTHRMVQQYVLKAYFHQ
jgi:glycogen phosphorylase